MASDDGRTRTYLESELVKQPYQFDFYQAVRLLTEQGIDSEVDPHNSHKQWPIPNRIQALDQHLEFDTEAGQRFAVNDIHHIRLKHSSLENVEQYGVQQLKSPEVKRSKHNVSLATFSMTGTQGPLPQQHCELVFNESRDGNSSLKAFLNIFEHRFISLLYLVKRKCNSGLNASKRKNTEIYQFLKRISGSSLEPLTLNSQNKESQEASLLAFAGLLSGGRKSVAVIQNVLSSVLNVPVKFAGMQGEFEFFSKDNQVRLKSQASEAQRLGSNQALGRRVWNQAKTLKLRIDAIDYQRVVDWFPKTPLNDKELDLQANSKHLRFRDLCLSLSNSQWPLEISYGVKPDSIPMSQLGSSQQLGWTTWLKSRESIDQESQNVWWTSQRLAPEFMVR